MIRLANELSLHILNNKTGTDLEMNLPIGCQPPTWCDPTAKCISILIKFMFKCMEIV